MKKQLTLTVQDTDYTFLVTTAAYNRLVNASPNNPSGAVIQFLESTVIADHKAALQTLMDEQPAAPQSMGEVLVKHFAPRVEVTLKNNRCR